MKFNVDINGVKYTGDGGFATEDTLAKLLKAYSTVNKTALKATQAADKALGGLADSADVASDSVVEFGDELDKAEAATKRAANKLQDMGDKANDAASSLFSAGQGGASFSGMISSVGAMAGDAFEGAAKLIPVFGDGVGQLGKTVATVAVGLIGAAVAMVESFQDLNKQIITSGLSVEGGFDKFTQYAEDARMPMNEFSGALIASSVGLRRMAGGQAGGVKYVSAALSEMTADMRGNLYSLGFTTDEIVAAMVDYSGEAHRAGEMLTPTELAVKTQSYLKNLNELARLTGTSVKEMQAKLEADRNNLFIQNRMMQVSEENRAAFASFGAAVPEAYSAMKDYILTGQSFSQQSALMVSQFPAVANAFKDTADGIANGSMSVDQANEYLADRIKKGGPQIQRELIQLANTLGIAPAELMNGMADNMGEAADATRQLLQGNLKGVNEVTKGSLQELLGTMETSMQSITSFIQSVFVDTLTAVAPLLEGFVGGLGDGASQVAALRDRIEEFLSNVSANGLSSVFSDLIANMTTALTDAISKGVHDGIWGATEPLAKADMPSVATHKDTAKGELSYVPSRGRGQAEKVYLDGIEIAVSEQSADIRAMVADMRKENLETRLSAQEAAKAARDNPPTATPLPDDYVEPLRDAMGNILGPGNAKGGIVSGPASGYAALLHGTEAVVPLPDGKSIPVDMSGLRTALEAALTPDSNPAEVANAMDELASTFSLDSSKIIDGSRTMPELLQINKNLLQQYFALNEKFERMVKAMEDGNNINRSSAFSRA